MAVIKDKDWTHYDVRHPDERIRREVIEVRKLSVSKVIPDHYAREMYVRGGHKFMADQMRSEMAKEFFHAIRDMIEVEFHDDHYRGDVAAVATLNMPYVVNFFDGNRGKKIPPDDELQWESQLRLSTQQELQKETDEWLIIK